MIDPARPLVAVASLGGTITMTGQNGVLPTLQAADLIRAVPALDRAAQLTAATLATVPGASLRVADLRASLRWAHEQVNAGAHGVVIAQGTDTIEETSYWLHLHWDRSAPLVVTGAMRAPAAISADGPANLLAAVRVAASTAAQDRGVLVVLDQIIHAADRVRKENTSALGAFHSPTGPIGIVTEDVPVFFGPPAPRATVTASNRDVQVVTIGTGVDDDGILLDLAVSAGVDGIVVAAFGAGHVPARVAAAVERAASRIPVVIASRTGAGRTLHSTYGFDGSEKDLIARGALLGAWLDPWKARILLTSLLASGLSGDALHHAFNAFADPFSIRQPGRVSGPWEDSPTTNC